MIYTSRDISYHSLMIVMFFNAKELPHRVLENFELYLGREAKWHNLCLLYYLVPSYTRGLYQINSLALIVTVYTTTCFFWQFKN